MNPQTILITGAAGNLGSLASQYFLQNSSHQLHLMYHSKEIEKSIAQHKRVKIFKCDLAKKETLEKSMKNVDMIIHFAGKLFKAAPQKFLPLTNTQYFRNLVTIAKKHHIERIILISFPHVEGPTTKENPSTDRIDKTPVSIHAQTRLEEEKHLLGEVTHPIILRVGMVYGAGILMPDVMKWLARYRLMGIWKKPTPIHLISKVDFCESLLRAASNPDVIGTYNIGDDGQQSLQEFITFACKVWKTKPPWELPLWLIYTAAWISERVSSLCNLKSPLTKDFIDVGRVPYYGDTSRMKKELLPMLTYKTMRDGKETF